MGGNWRELMPAMHVCAKSLAREGRIEILQRGVRVVDFDAIKGPYRLRRVTT